MTIFEIPGVEYFQGLWGDKNTANFDESRDFQTFFLVF